MIVQHKFTSTARIRSENGDHVMSRCQQSVLLQLLTPPVGDLTMGVTGLFSTGGSKSTPDWCIVNCWMESSVGFGQKKQKAWCACK